MAGGVRRVVGRVEREAPAEEGVGWIGDLDFGQVMRKWVIEGGIRLIYRSMVWTTNG